MSLRWSHALDIFDMGGSWFKGVDRDRIFEILPSDGPPQLASVHEDINKVGAEVQATIAAWLLIFEWRY